MPLCSTRPFFGALIAGCLALSGPAAAQTLTENTTLSFGEVAMYDNSSPRDITLLSGGGYTMDPGYYLYGNPPQLGSYTIQGQTPNWPMDIDLTLVGSINRGGPGPVFTVVDFFTVPAVVMTDGAGNATFQVGGTLRSSGVMGNYPDDNYTGSYTITVTPQ